MARPLGKNQEGVLAAMSRHRGMWYVGCGWVWSNPSSTVRILRTLEKRGLVEEFASDKYGPKFRITTPKVPL